MPIDFNGIRRRYSHWRPRTTYTFKGVVIIWTLLVQCTVQIQVNQHSKGESIESEVKAKENDYEVTASQVLCAAPEEHLCSVCDAVEEPSEVANAEFSPCRRRWPKLPRATSERDRIGRLVTNITASSFDCLSEGCAPKPERGREVDLVRVSIRSRKSAVNRRQKVQKRLPPADSVRVVGSSQAKEKDDSCLEREIAETGEKIRNELPREGSPPGGDSNTVAYRTRRQKLMEKKLTGSAEKTIGEVLPVLSGEIGSDPKTGVFSAKSKRSLERAAFSIMGRKRRDECYQRAAAGGYEAKSSDVHDRILTKAEGTCTDDWNGTEMERKEQSDNSLQTSLKMTKMTISGPADAFREISVDHSFRRQSLPGTEGEARDSDASCIGDHQLAPANNFAGLLVSKLTTQERDSLGTDQVLGPPGQEARCSNMEALVTAAHCTEYSDPPGHTSAVPKGVTKSSSSGICKETQPRDPPEIICRKEGKLISHDIPRIWTNPLHQEMGSADLRSASLSSEKFSNILSYLVHVEESNLQENYRLLPKRDVVQEGTSSYKCCQSPCTVLEHEDSVSLANSTSTTSSLTNISCNQSGDGEIGMNPATSLFEGVRKKMQEFKSKIADKESQNAELLRDIERLKADKEQALSLERDRFGRELEVRAAEYKAAIQHHLALNEKMVKDKEALSEKCCNLAGILSTVESKYEEKIRVLKEQFAQELKKQKDIWIAGEKPRREIWKEKKIKEIKELTIKGLEPHIEGLNEKHKQEIKRLEMTFADETQKKLEIQSIQHREEMCELRNRILKERDEILEKERMAGLTRLNDVAEKYEHQAMELRRKISSDISVEFEKVEEARRKEKQMSHEMLSKAREEWKEREAALKNSVENCVQEAVAEKDAELHSLRSELGRLKNEWQKDFDEQLRQNIQVREDEFKARCTKERDEQIEMIIERMENEKDEAIAQNQQELLANVETLMEEKLEMVKKLKEVESKCAGLCKISLEAKQKAETETANKDLQVESLRREMLCQTDLIEQLKTQIQQEKKNLKEQVQRQELQVAKEHDLVLAAKQEVERCNAETEQLRQRKAKELEELEIHVRQAIENKDQTIAGLREQLLAAREQIRHTELLLQQEHVAFLADPD